MHHAIIIAIGDELLSGELVDTNSQLLDSLLEARGYRVLEHRTVPDERAAIAEAFTEASRRAELVLSTGGLGPTQDDVSFESLALALGRPLREDAAALQHIAARFFELGRPMTDNNKRQAMIPEGAEALINASGTAPGLMATLNGAQIFCMPGVPREVRWLMEHRILPRIPARPQPILRRALRVVGLGESSLETELWPVIAAHPGVQFGFRTHGLINSVKLACRDEAALEGAEAAVAAALGPDYLGQEPLELHIGRQLQARGATIATAESLTAGALAAKIASVPGASEYLLGGVVSYSAAVKRSLLSVPAEALAEGAVNERVARRMAEGARAQLGADFALATTGLAGPGQGGEAAPVGTVWVALAGPEGTEARRLRFGARGRAWVQENAVVAALDLLRRALRSNT